jgi:hypothetical protein
MFHDMGLTPKYGSAGERFEVDSANAAREFMRSRGIAQGDIDTVWTAIALHTTPGVPQHMHPVIALVTSGVEMDVLGWAYDDYSDAERAAVVGAYPRSNRFKEDIIQAFYDGMKHRPATTFGTVNADVIADKEPGFKAGNFCAVIRGSDWSGWRTNKRRADTATSSARLEAQRARAFETAFSIPESGSSLVGFDAKTAPGILTVTPTDGVVRYRSYVRIDADRQLRIDAPCQAVGSDDAILVMLCTTTTLVGNRVLQYIAAYPWPNAAQPAARWAARSFSVPMDHALVDDHEQALSA